MDPTPTPEQKQLLHQARRAKLMQIWASGSRRLSADELAEIADLTTPAPLAASGDDAPPPARSFTLGDGAAPLPAKLRGYHAKPLADYAATYNRSDRTIKRWNSAGRNVQPPDLPPLDAPGSMAAWFRRLFAKEPVPRELLEYERRAPPPPVASSGNPPPPPELASTEAPAAEAAAHGTNGGRSLGEPPPTEPNRMTAVNLAELSLEEGELVGQMRSIVQANYHQVDAALKAQDQDAYRRWFPIYNESGEALRKLEKEFREAAKASGSMLPRAQIIAELSQMLESLRLMREAMPAKIIAELGKRTEGRCRRVLKLIEADLAEAIQKVRQREGDLLTTIDSLRSPGAARDAFSLAA